MGKCFKKKARTIEIVEIIEIEYKAKAWMDKNKTNNTLYTTT